MPRARIAPDAAAAGPPLLDNGLMLRPDRLAGREAIAAAIEAGHLPLRTPPMDAAACAAVLRAEEALLGRRVTHWPTGHAEARP